MGCSYIWEWASEQHLFWLVYLYIGYLFYPIHRQGHFKTFGVQRIQLYYELTSKRYPCFRVEQTCWTTSSNKMEIGSIPTPLAVVHQPSLWLWNFTRVKNKKNLVIYFLFFGKIIIQKFSWHISTRIFILGAFEKKIITFWIGSKIMLSFLGVVAIDATSESSKEQRKHFTLIMSFASRFKTNFSLEFDWKKKP